MKKTDCHRKPSFTKKRLLPLLTAFFSLVAVSPAFCMERDSLRLSTFDIDVTPSPGSYLAYGIEKNTWDLGLRARGIVLLGAGRPIALCAVDWIGIGSEGHDAFCAELADALGTSPDRIAVQTVHQHDTPWCNYGAEQLLSQAGLPVTKYDGTFAREVVRRLGKAARESLQEAVSITEVGFGEAMVYQVASNRRIRSAKGDTIITRLSSCSDPVLRNAPEGTIDPVVSVVSFWHNNKPVAILSYYATHPQSYYRTGIANPDFPGLARFLRQLEVPQALHIHFNGAGGNVAAGKYNDGSPENRGILARRLADGMKNAWEGTTRFSVTKEDIRWNVEPVFLPPAAHLWELKDGPPDSLLVKSNAARLAWLLRCERGIKINISCLSVGKIRILHLPGEPFVEFQLAAKSERKDLKVAVAGYGDAGPGYIGTRESYSEGGYETSYVSNVSQEAGDILMEAVRKLLHR